MCSLYSAITYLLTANIVCCSRSRLRGRCFSAAPPAVSCCYSYSNTLRPPRPVSHFALLFVHSCFQSWLTQTSYCLTSTPPTSPPTATTTFSPCSRTTSPAAPSHETLPRCARLSVLRHFTVPLTLGEASCVHTHTHTRTHAHTRSDGVWHEDASEKRGLFGNSGGGKATRPQLPTPPNASSTAMALKW